ncbi:MAG: hypothetical protein GF317_03480 [Candidatus Lokiarchaeota archaeon]|nr:hypothetical protein [Candidatus Lokiarchaeota archaeon]MBD3198957.1 hypothetical protein [Candidatus Lokiarchaeota archaeon]
MLVALLPYEILIIYIYPDDSYYFFEIAKNLSREGILSFDRIHITNGFQPLWLILLVPVFLFNIPNLLALRIIILYQGILTGISLLFVYKTLLHLFNKNSAKFGTLILAFLPISFFAYLGGCEASLNLLGLSYLLYYIITNDLSKLSYKNTIILGLVMGLSLFTRLDNVIIISSIIAWLIFSGIVRFKKENIKKIIVFILIFPVIPGIYLLWNYLLFGNFMPISGILLKSSTTYAVLYVLVIVFVCFIINIILRLTIKRYTNKNWEEISQGTKFLIIIFLLPLFHFLYYQFIGGRFVHWYLAIELLSLTIGSAFIFHSLPRISNLKIENTNVSFIALSLILIFTIVPFFGGFLFDVKLYQLSPRYYEATQWVNENLPKNSTLASANAGFLGYFIEQPLIESWGLVNSFEFIEKYNGNRTKFIIEGDYDYYIDQTQYIPLNNTEMQAQNLTFIIEFYDVWAPYRTLEIWKKN